MKKEIISALLGGVMGGALSLYATILTIKSQEESTAIQIQSNSSNLIEQMDSQFNYQDRKNKQDRLFSIMSEIMLTYGDVTKVRNSYKQSNEYWFNLNSYSQLLNAIGEHKSAGAVVEFYKNGRPKDNSEQETKKFWSHLKQMRLVFADEMEKYES